jgi:signal transduction histidine kinase
MRTRRPGWSLHARMTLAFGLLMSGVVSAVLLLWIGGSEAYELELTQRLNLDVARHLAEHAVPLDAEGAIDEEQLGGMLMHVMSVNPALEVYLLDTTGNVLAYDAPEGHVKRLNVGLAPLQDLLGGAQLPVLGDDPRSEDGVQPISVWPLDVESKTVGFVYVVLNGEALRETAGPLRGSRQLRTFAFSTVAVLLVGIAVNFLLARRLTQPLRLLRDVIGTRKTKLPAKVFQAKDEIGLLAQTYVDMAEQIEDQVRALERSDSDRRQFVASVSHDLRTPLASLQGYLELLEEREAHMPAEEREFVVVARRRALHLSHLVDQLFQLAKLEAGDVEPHLEDFNLAELTQDVLQGLRPRAQDAGVRLRCRMPRHLPDIHGDLGLIERAVTNLVDNALKFTPEGGAVSVRMTSTPGGVEWSVQDDGPGISSSDLDHIFERRFRGSRDASTPGTGLGLSITHRVLELHGASIEVQSTEGEGCLFSFSIPAA